MIVSLNVIRKGLAQIVEPMTIGVPTGKIGLIESLYIDHDELLAWGADRDRKPRIFVPQPKSQFLPETRLLEVATSVRVDGDDTLTVLQSPREIGNLIKEAAERGYAEPKAKFGKNFEFLWTC